MKLRALLLVSCMVVVPALAMFSHLIPAEVRASARRGLHAATNGVLGAPAEAGMAAPAPQTGSQGNLLGQAPLHQTDLLAPATPLESLPIAASGGFPSTLAASGSGAAGIPSVAALARPAAAAGAGATRSLLPDGSAAAAADPVGPPLVAELADRARQVRDQQQRDQQAIEAQLRAAGAVSFDCQPLPGADGMISCSCRVPIDAAGQLQRVFQSTGHDPLSASAALLEQVLAWRQRMAAPSHGPPAGEVGDGRSIPGDRYR